MRWFLNVAYGLLLLALFPLLLYRRLVLRKDREGLGEKLLGRLPEIPRATGQRIWFHAVSVGEVLQLQSLIAALREERQDIDCVITTTTSTGLGVAREKFPEIPVCYFPLDFTWAVKRAFDRIAPDLVVLVELELWPNFILEAKRRDTPAVLINGRIGGKSFRGYRRIRPLMRHLLDCFRRLAVQNETYRRRLIDLGAPPERVDVTGSVKYDGVETDRNNPQTAALREIFGLQTDEIVFVAGSTQHPEEDYALDAWLTLQSDHPDLRLIIVPRHRERFEQVAEMIHERGLPLLRRSMPDRVILPEHGQFLKPGFSENQVSEHTWGCASKGIPPVLLLDTLGELSACWGLADAAFVGGSFTSRGGQNMIEPAAYGAAVLFGPNTWNFQDVVDLLLAENAARVVADRGELIATLRFLLENPHIARAQGETAREIVLRQHGATRKTVELILEALPGDGGHLQALRAAA